MQQSLKFYFAGIKSSGKVVYFSATSSYLLLITLMIYALLQDGANVDEINLRMGRYEHLMDRLVKNIYSIIDTNLIHEIQTSSASQLGAAETESSQRGLVAEAGGPAQGGGQHLLRGCGQADRSGWVNNPEW